MFTTRALFIGGLSLVVSGCCGELEARRYNEDLDCLGEIEDVGCPADADCKPGRTVAESSYGSVWIFSDTCIPEDYTLIEGPFAEGAVDAPLCSSL